MTMSQIIITIVTSVLASSGCWSVALYFIQKRDKEREKKKDGDDAEREMLMALAHDRLYYLLERLLREYQTGEREGISRDEFGNLKILYDSYKKLGGNGTCEKMYKELEKMPLVAYYSKGGTKHEGDNHQ